MKKLRPVEELELVPCTMETLLVSQYEGVSAAILSAGGKRFAHVLNSVEGTALIFQKSGLAEHAHIKNIYQMYYQTMCEMDITLESVTLEAIHGDIMYCKLQWCTAKHRRFYATCSVGDALVLAVMADAPLYIVRKTLDKLESCNEWLYENDIWDDDMRL